MKSELAIQYKFRTMGGEQSKRMEEIVQLLKQYQFRQKGSISEDEFVCNLFISLDLTKADEKCTPVFISGMEILRLFYAQLVAANRGPPSRSKAIKAIQQLYENPKEAIQCSFRLLQSKNQAYITKDSFVDFFLNSFSRGTDAILKHQNFDADFKNNFKEWIQTNKATLISSAQRMFAENAQSTNNIWTEGDFRRWILNKSNWNIFVKIRGNSYNIPLNLPSLFSIRLEQSS